MYQNDYTITWEVSQRPDSLQLEYHMKEKDEETYIWELSEFIDTDMKHSETMAECMAHVRI